MPLIDALVDLFSKALGLKFVLFFIYICTLCLRAAKALVSDPLRNRLVAQVCALVQSVTICYFTDLIVVFIVKMVFGCAVA